MNVEIQNLTKEYGKVKALDNISLHLKKGCIIGLLGPNGSGKTTLIKLLNGLIQPTSGSLFFDGNGVGVYSKARISYLPDQNYVNEYLTVDELVTMFSDFYDDFNKEKVEKLIGQLELPRDKKIKALSKGTKEKVQLCLVMSRDAELYLLDEPIGGVDPLARDYILETIITNYNPDATVVISTHLIQDVENILDEVIMIKKGSILLEESVDNIRERTGKSVNELFKEMMK